MRATRIRVAVSLLVLLTSISVLSGGQGPLLPPGGVFPVLETYLESMRQQARIPGMSAAVLRDEQIVWERGFGFQNVETRVRATPDTPYLVGNVTSTLAAVLLLQCVEQRRLDLDEPFRRYELTQPEPDATLRQVLSHASPDTKEFAYSPERFSQLTAVMEWCAPQPFRKSVAHRILEHLAMRDSVPGVDLKDPDLALPEGLFRPEDLERYRGVLDRMALPYRVVSRSRVEQTEIPAMSLTASNGLVSTVRDLARFDQALDAGRSGGLLLDETLDLAWTPATGPAGDTFPTGLGWFVQSYKGERVVWQFGYIPNAYSSLVLKVPARHLTFILLANSDALSAPFHLETGNVTRSLFATLFLRLVK